MKKLLSVVLVSFVLLSIVPLDVFAYIDDTIESTTNNEEEKNDVGMDKASADEPKIDNSIPEEQPELQNGNSTEVNNSQTNQLKTTNPVETLTSNNEEVITIGNFEFHMNDQVILEYTAVYNNTGVIEKYYQYYTGTIMSNHLQHIKYIYYVDASGKIKYISDLEDNSSKLRYNYFYLNASYGEAIESKLDRIYVFRTDGSLS
ncbi:hypothetical protein [Culicoidibacter larvae]|uniref:Uncharacterized protein n=1 Tax=Culicoidibacter larvae TaxID=2579976 RepID=A0A5R8QG58_9FIRM|nr:hypothetical protein [Culicoidibacter larvae]TLG75473.1 hypothetical protein FEZ08_05350 [Culicoidibacter larvae]